VSVGEPAAGFYVIVNGDGVLTLEQTDTEVAFTTGDLLLLTRPAAHRLRQSEQAETVDLEELLLAKRFSGGAGLAERPCARIVACHLEFPRRASSLLPLAMPPCIRVPGENRQVVSWLATLLRLMLTESSGSKPGQRGILDRLAHVVVIYALRDFVARLPENGEPWLRALLDPSIGMALGLIHRCPERPWTVASLASEVAMSRSAFADRFSTLVGTSPVHYLTERRMQIACRLLRDPSISIAEIASRVGYQSPAAFNNAFRRWAGAAPGVFRRAADHPC
jgi:AraC-like DNA-binding protein